MCTAKSCTTPATGAVNVSTSARRRLCKFAICLGDFTIGFRQIGHCIAAELRFRLLSGCGWIRERGLGLVVLALERNALVLLLHHCWV